MIRSTLIAAVPVVLAAFAGVAEASATCNMTSPCSLNSAPCCSEFGFCGTKNFCLGGCNPYSSKALDSCRPEPLCQDGTLAFADKSRILSNSTLFDGNSTKYDWVVDKGSIQDSDNGAIALILTDKNGGTRVSSTRYVHYGTITATLKTGRWGGVVTAFITMSDVKDEIDWEWPGAKTTEGQSNFFWQGVVPDKTAGGTHGGLSDTFSNFHDYTIDWQPDQLTWSIDGKVVRTLKKADTMVNGVANYPSTPSRIQLSLWPAGIDGTSKGTVDWSGGMINFDDPDYKSAGHFYAIVKQVTVKCINAQPVTAGSNITSYVYSGTKDQSKTPTIVYSNHSSLLNGANRMVPDLGSMSGALLALAMGTLVGVNAMLL